MKKVTLGLMIILLSTILTPAISVKVREPSTVELKEIVFLKYDPRFQKDKPCDLDGVCDPGEKGWCDDCKVGGEEPTANPCYDFIAGSKPKWSWVEDYYFGDIELQGPSDSAVVTWESAAAGDIFRNGFFGAHPWGTYDNHNSLSYGDYPEEGVIAVTKIWFRGKNIYEYDIMFDLDYFPNTNVDLPTVTLHEFGHAAGLGDLYDSVCMDNIMYGYYIGEKTQLSDGDKAGIQELYGA